MWTVENGGLCSSAQTWPILPDHQGSWQNANSWAPPPGYKFTTRSLNCSLSLCHVSCKQFVCINTEGFDLGHSPLSPSPQITLVALTDLYYGGGGCTRYVLNLINKRIAGISVSFCHYSTCVVSIFFLGQVYYLESGLWSSRRHSPFRPVPSLD